LPHTKYNWYSDSRGSGSSYANERQGHAEGIPLRWMASSPKKSSHIAVGKHGQVETIPRHRELAKGTEHALIKRLRAKENQSK
jgi:hypothetical protein